MTDTQTSVKTDGSGLPLPATAGALLGAAREASGLSIDAVAQQLKLAPRQVRALEEDDYTHLPGRTFVRGFVRNYARLVRLDPDKVVAALPAGAAAPALEAPTLQQTAQTMGELPTTDHSKPGWARWAIPLILAAVVAGAAVYEWLRPLGVTRPTAARDTAGGASPAARSDATGTPLPNPLATGMPVAEPASVPASVPESGPAGTAVPASAATAAAPAAEQSLAFAFRDYSWTEVRDAGGRLLLSGMNRGGTTQNISGTPPFDVVIGNAADVRLTYGGAPVDLAPHTRQNVARFRLP